MNNVHLYIYSIYRTLNILLFYLYFSVVFTSGCSFFLLQIPIENYSLEVFTNLNSTIFWDLTTCSLVEFPPKHWWPNLAACCCYFCETCNFQIRRCNVILEQYWLYRFLTFTFIMKLQVSQTHLCTYVISCVNLMVISALLHIHFCLCTFPCYVVDCNSSTASVCLLSRGVITQPLSVNFNIMCFEFN
jgi:hypothetical protein